MSTRNQMPTPTQIEDAILRARRLRAEYAAALLRSAALALRAIPSRLVAALHRPAHG